MRRRPSCQNTIMIAYFVFQYGCLATRRGEEKKQWRTRAAQQRSERPGCNRWPLPCFRPVPDSVSDPEESRPVLRPLVKVFRFPAICCSAFYMRRVRDQTREPGCIRAQLDGGLFEVASQRSTSGTWKRVALRRLSWPCGAGRREYRECFPRLNCARERSGRTDRDPAEPRRAHIPKSALPVALQGGGPSGVAVDSLVAAAVHYARSGRRFDGCRCLACRRVP